MDGKNFLATIVTQTGGSGGAELNGDAATIVEKYKHPIIKSVKVGARFEEYSESDGEREGMFDLSDADGFKPQIYINSRQLPSLIGKKVDDKFCLYVECTLKDYSYFKDNNGKEEHRYTLRLDEAKIEDEIE